MNYYKIIEELNYDYLDLNKKEEFLNTVSNQKINNLLKNKNYQLLIQKSLKHLPIFRIYYKHMLNKINIKNKDYYYSNTDNLISNKKIVVYTCITGNYDVIEDPLIKEENVDFVVITDNDFKNNIWKTKKIPDKVLEIKNNALINRYIKLHPFELFGDEYDYALYIDGNIKIMSTISDLIHTIDKNIGLSLHKHCNRNDVYNELLACKLIGRAKFSDCNKQIKRLKKEGFPRNYGLCECNAILVDLKNETAKKVYSKWWDDLMAGETHRDQISFVCALKYFDILPENISKLGNNIYLNPKFRVNNHL